MTATLGPCSMAINNDAALLCTDCSGGCRGANSVGCDVGHMLLELESRLTCTPCSVGRYSGAPRTFDLANKAQLASCTLCLVCLWLALWAICDSPVIKLVDRSRVVICSIKAPARASSASPAPTSRSRARQSACCAASGRSSPSTAPRAAAPANQEPMPTPAARPCAPPRPAGPTYHLQVCSTSE